MIGAYRCGCFCLFITLISQIFCQDIPTVILCSQSGPLPQRFGQIVHIQDNEGQSRLCEIQLPALSDSYMIVDGVEETGSPNSCTSGSLSVNGDSFCVDEDNAHVFTSMPIMRVSSITANFTISYYDTVFRCGGGALPQVNLSDSVWTGVISSPLPGQNRLYQGTCKVTVTGLPPGSDIRLQLFDSFRPQNSLEIRVSNQDERLNRNNRAITITADREGKFEIQSSHEVLVSLQYLLGYYVIRCGDIPSKDNSTHAEPDPPYLPGHTIQYQCVDNYQFKDKSSITCVSDGTDASWTDSDVKCVPVPWCVDDPATVTNSNRSVILQNRSIEYECKEGYKSTNGIDTVLVYCSTLDNETIPWTWNDTNIKDTFSCRSATKWCERNQYHCTAAVSWNITLPKHPNSDGSVVKCEKISDVQRQLRTTEKLEVVGAQQQVVIIGSVLGFVCILLISGLVFFVIRSRKLTTEIQRLTESGKTQQVVAERNVTIGQLNNPTEYEEVGLDLSRINPAVDSENSNQVNNEANTYENFCAKIAGNTQPRSAEYEIVKQGGVGEDNHVYTSLNY